ncbi:MAG: hypothetical protein A2651_00280 [Candidatus Yanofskybacteria bacterium RIFCSPHIGHO2_01_FULL_42_12]|uniref:Uncharacterized protein n=1 Tax=Candidatus Yanofskybacteria bacterium RIFCSPLOWO2_01_FULL_42_49 TaxID=1802694 RepID=A0A1F8GA87_9BACT|nr:MAG: hypothetical protein A2651_00280 [Candidatus Yanofskybacteria bacterium RIFCSPHIGHO2_01_FULL_42_12]OGN22292.1 MAG: hypothetical protein A2918_00005 [Candidatus Yanofskybacteria bacterium RIFCSPLOWO2_01_FULL_42_49]
MSCELTSKFYFFAAAKLILVKCGVAERDASFVSDKTSKNWGICVSGVPPLHFSSPCYSFLFQRMYRLVGTAGVFVYPAAVVASKPCA